MVLSTWDSRYDIVRQENQIPTLQRFEVLAFALAIYSKDSRIVMPFEKNIKKGIWANRFKDCAEILEPHLSSRILSVDLAFQRWQAVSELSFLHWEQTQGAMSNRQTMEGRNIKRGMTLRVYSFLELLAGSGCFALLSTTRRTR